MSCLGQTYFQFPLCALAFGATERERLDHIISLGVFEAGATLFRKLPVELQARKPEEFAAWPETPTDYRKNNREHVAALLGAQAIGVTLGSVGASARQYRALGEFRFELQQKYGPDAEVRVEKGLVFEARDRKGLCYRELAMLCAVYSCIGAKKHPCRITRDMIQRRMLGYKTEAVMRAEIANRKDTAQPLTLRQINYTLDKLYERQFFARARANERQTYYSNRLTQDELENALINSKSYSEEFRQRRIQRDQTFMQRIKEERAAIKVNDPIKVDNATGGCSNGVHSASAGSSAAASAGRSL